MLEKQGYGDRMKGKHLSLHDCSAPDLAAGNSTRSIVQAPHLGRPSCPDVSCRNRTRSKVSDALHRARHLISMARYFAGNTLLT